MDKIKKLKKYFEKNQDVNLAFLYGSVARQQEHNKSDIDILVSLKNQESEDKIWRELNEIIGEEIDLVSCQDAPATLISNAFKTGTPLSIKDKNLFWDLYLDKTMEAEDFAEFVSDYWKIYQRSKSLSPEDQSRLLERLEFLKREIGELGKFSKIKQSEYEGNSSIRRELERWTENIINALIDIAKIILASSKEPIPKTYESALQKFAFLAGMSESQSQKFSAFARLRNILAHEYLDILYAKISDFIKEFPELYQFIDKFLDQYLEKS